MHASPNPDRERRSERGQVLVVFTLAMVVIIGMVGLVLDGGSTFAQRRDEQNVADLAAHAGATTYLNASGTAYAKAMAAEAAARGIAAANGYMHDPANGVTVNVYAGGTVDGGSVTVEIGKPHVNNFAGLLGMPTWGVGVDATAVASQRPNAALGAMPLLFNQEAFPGAVCDEDRGTCVDEVYQLPGTGTQDVPQDATQFNWTVFCTHLSEGAPCNGTSDDVRDLMRGDGTNVEVDLTDDIGPLNAGEHATLFGELENHQGSAFPVPIVDDAGQLVGWGYFRLTAIEGSPDRVIRGHFIAPYFGSRLSFTATGGNATVSTGSYVLELVD